MKTRSRYVCQECGHAESKWLGRCPGCQAWSSLVEEVVMPRSATSSPLGTTAARPQPLNAIDTSDDIRTSTGVQELDRVLGGGLVEGALVLVGGDPGIGKSTLLLQTLGNLAKANITSLYMTAEESARQVKMRADRLGINTAHIHLLADTQIERLDQARREVRPRVMVVDSVQTVGVGAVESAVGSVSQIRAVTQALMTVAKVEGVTTFVVGHVTKEGTIAGPRVMEHMVDTVLYFEGDRSSPYRILRAHKNRFGSAQELGVFEMTQAGLQAVDSPSSVFLAQRAEGPGAVVVTSLEGTRPILLEVQALTTQTFYPSPRRTTIGIDQQRVAMLCAVLSSRAHVELSGVDVYVNVAGGVRINEPAADLGVVLALTSSMQGIQLSNDLVAIGEVGLSGEVRGCSQIGVRVQEAEALGFSKCLVPRIDLERWTGAKPKIALVPVGHIREALEEAGLR